jgi:uncharacterized protein YprB with RNaseH-like and TPR domain
VNFKAKLARLAPPPQVALPQMAAPPDIAEVSRTTGTSGSCASDQRAFTLAGLREKIAEVMGRPAPLLERAEPSATILPFVREDREHGTLYRRLEPLRPSHHVGRMPVDSAAAARSELVALLALDPRLSGCSFERALFLDTETTGLGGGAGVVAFLIGMAWFDSNRRLHLEQLLVRKLIDERAMLERLRECVEACEVIVTYNGKSFDWPLLLGRCVMNRAPSLPERPHLDLLHVARRLHKARLGVCRLISLERSVLGFERGPDIAGADVAAHYSHFLRTGDERALEGVVSHNAFDVISMAALVGLYGEPVELLPAQDLVGMARTLRRAGALAQADDVIEAALSRGGGSHARRARVEISKARGDRARALADLKTLVDELDDPALRLQLAKLYEHFVKAPLLALELLDRGTGETDQASARRRARLQHKLEKH